MRVLSVDLASNRYRDIGVAVIGIRADSVAIEFVEASAYGLKGRPCVKDVTSWLTELASAHEADAIFIDGPQGWKDPANGLEHARRCERELATPGKTGLPGCVKPGSWTRMATFSIELFDALSAIGFLRVHSHVDLLSGRRLALESFPTSAWRTLGLKPLPSKSRTSDSQLRTWTTTLEKLIQFTLTRSPTHDELQALVAGLAGLPLLRHQGVSFKLFGSKPTKLMGTWREGFIINPVIRSSEGLLCPT
jgi:hypothetical protein